jgi:hypothetical protein
MVSEITKEGAQAPEKHNSELSAALWAHKPEPGAHGLRSEAASDAAAAHLTKLTISDKAQAVPSNASREANSFLLKASDETVNKSIYRLPSWSHLSKPDPGVGCVSSFSNRYREALRLAGDIPNVNGKQFRNYYQVNLDEMNRVMGQDKLLARIDVKDVKEGDVIEGVNPDTTKRHVGIVGRVENGQRMVYDNYGGIWHKESLSARFGEYQQENFYRAYLPPKS